MLFETADLTPGLIRSYSDLGLYNIPDIFGDKKIAAVSVPKGYYVAIYANDCSLSVSER